MVLIFSRILTVCDFAFSLEVPTADVENSPSNFSDSYFVGWLIVGDGFIGHFH